MADQNLDMRGYLAQLEAQRAALNIQIAGVRAALGLAEDNGAEVVTATSIPLPGMSLRAAQGQIQTGVVRPDEFFKMSVPEGIQRFLEIKKQPAAPKDIADGLKAGGILSEAKHFYANVFTALKRLRAQGLVVNTKRGGWGLAEWYAGRSGSEAKPPKRARNPKAAKKPSKPTTKKKAATGGTKKPKSPYHAFIGEQMKAGKTMAEAAEMWRARATE